MRLSETHLRISIIALLSVAVVLIGLSLLVATMESMPAGTFAADYYYLPMHEYVAPEKHREREKTLIELYNAKSERLSMIRWSLHLVPIACVLISLFLLVISPEMKDYHGDFSLEPY